MALEKGDLAILGVVAVVIAIAAGWLGAPYAAVPAPTGAVFVGVEGIACPTDLKTSVAVFGIKSVLTTAGEEQAVNGTSAYVYKNDDTSVWDTITMLSAGYEKSTSGSELDCGEDEFRVIAGLAGSSGYYWEESEKKTAGTASDRLKFTLDEVGTLTPLVYVSGTVPNASQTIASSAGATNTQGKLQIEEASGAVFRNPTIFFDYNTTAFESVEVVGGTLGEIPTRLSGYEKSYTLGRGDLANYDLWNGITVKAVLRSTMVTNETVTILVADEGNFISNGEIVTGYEDLTDADVMASDSSTVEFIYQY